MEGGKTTSLIPAGDKWDDRCRERERERHDVKDYLLLQIETR